MAGRVSRRLTGSLVAPDVSSRCRPAGRQPRQTSVWRSWSQSASARGRDPYLAPLRGWDRDAICRLHVATGMAVRRSPAAARSATRAPRHVPCRRPSHPARLRRPSLSGETGAAFLRPLPHGRAPPALDPCPLLAAEVCGGGRVVMWCAIDNMFIMRHDIQKIICNKCDRGESEPAIAS